MSSDSNVHEKLLKSIQESIDQQTQEIKSHIGREIADLRKLIGEETRKRTDLEEKYKQLQGKYTILEKAIRKNNIIIFGLENKTEKKLIEFTIDTLNEQLKLNLSKKDVNNIFTIGQQNQNKPIIVKFVSFLTKVEVLRACHNLKNTSIRIAEELSFEERQKNKILHQHLKEAKSRNLNAYIKKNKLYVNGESYTPEQLVDREDDTDEETDEVEEEIIEESNNKSSGLIHPNSLTTGPSKKRTNGSQEEEEIGDKNLEDLQKYQGADPKKFRLTTTRSSSRNIDQKSKGVIPKENSRNSNKAK